MDFRTDKPIFRQIVDLCYNRILDRQWENGQKIPSVREFSVSLAVNTRTVLSAYEVLEQEGIIATRRGLGYFLTDEAHERVIALKRQEFISITVPKFFNELRTLGLTLDEVIQFINPNELYIH